MRWLLLADVHSNLEALDAVLQGAEARWGRLPIACAGDLVGYGPNPNECIDRLREREAMCVLGNHDLMVLGRISTRRCVPAGIRAAQWTRDCLRDEARAWLEALPMRLGIAGHFVLCHGSLSDAEEYVTTGPAARAQLRQMRLHFPGHRLIVCGHTHTPAWLEGGELQTVSRELVAVLPPWQTGLTNPGSVGQSRDRHPLARYAVFDAAAGTVEFRAASYDVETCGRKIRDAGLTTRLYLRSGSAWLEGCRLIARGAR